MWMNHKNLVKLLVRQPPCLPDLFLYACAGSRQTISTYHRHSIDKYLDTLLANQPISDGEATDHCQKVAPQDGGLPELIVARSCVTNHSEAASLWLVTPKQDVVGNHQWRHWHVICCNVEYLNCRMQNLRPSNIKVIFKRISCGSPIVVTSGFTAGTAPVVHTYLATQNQIIDKMNRWYVAFISTPAKRPHLALLTHTVHCTPMIYDTLRQTATAPLLCTNKVA